MRLVDNPSLVVETSENVRLQSHFFDDDETEDRTRAEWENVTLHVHD